MKICMICLLGCVLASTVRADGVDTTIVREAVDLRYVHMPDSVSVADGDRAAPSAPRRREVAIVKHHHHYGRQIGLSVGMMAFVLLFMTTAQAWNPD